MVKAVAVSRLVNYGMAKLKQALLIFGDDLSGKPLTFENTAEILLILQSDRKLQQLLPLGANLAAEGYQILHHRGQLLIIGADEKGLMYGTLDVAGQLNHNGSDLRQVQEKKQEPRLSFRALKFNLPFIAYRSSLSLTQQQ